MSTLFVGDIHCKSDLILPLVDKAINENKDIDHVVFLGDYVDHWYLDSVLSMRNLIKWKDSFNYEGIKLTFLPGNHDLAYLYNVQPCSGHNNSIHNELKELLIELFGSDNPNICILVEDNWVASHAGLTESWVRNYLKPNKISSLNDLVNQVNSLNDQEVIYDCGISRGGWGFPGPVWADKSELEYEPLKLRDLQINQVVGHSPVSFVIVSPRDFFHPNNEILVFCDTQSNDFNKLIIKASFVIIDKLESIREITYDV